LAKNDGPSSGLMTRIKGRVFYNCISGLSHSSKAKVHMYRKKHRMPELYNFAQ